MADTVFRRQQHPDDQLLVTGGALRTDAQVERTDAEGEIADADMRQRAAQPAASELHDVDMRTLDCLMQSLEAAHPEAETNHADGLKLSFPDGWIHVHSRPGEGAAFRVDLYPEADKIAKQFKYASARGIRIVAVLGETERSLGEVGIKNMETGEQRSVKRVEIAQELRRMLTQST